MKCVSRSFNRLIIPAILSGMSFSLCFPAYAKYDSDYYRDQIKSLEQEIKEDNQLIRSKQQTVSRIRLGALDSDPKFQGSCESPCQPSGDGFCSTADLKKVGLDEKNLGAQSACVAVYNANPALTSVSTGCRLVVNRCGEIAKKLEIAKLESDIRSLRLELKDKAKEKEQLRQEREDSDEVCTTCGTRFGRYQNSWMSGGFLGNIQSGLSASMFFQSGMPQMNPLMYAQLGYNPGNMLPYMSMANVYNSQAYMQMNANAYMQQQYLMNSMMARNSMFNNNMMFNMQMQMPFSYAPSYGPYSYMQAPMVSPFMNTGMYNGFNGYNGYNGMNFQAQSMFNPAFGPGMPFNSGFAPSPYGYNNYNGFNGYNGFNTYNNYNGFNGNNMYNGGNGFFNNQYAMNPMNNPGRYAQQNQTNFLIAQDSLREAQMRVNSFQQPFGVPMGGYNPYGMQGYNQAPFGGSGLLNQNMFAPGFVR